MEESLYKSYKAELEAKLEAYYQRADLFNVIELLENSELDFDLCMELVRTYINVANKSGDPYTLYEKATVVLDKNAIAGRDDPRWLFYKGYILYRQGLVEDALIRFERALKFASVADGALFTNICTMAENCKNEVKLSSFKGMNEANLPLYDEHLKKHFGKTSKFCSFNGVEVLLAEPNEEHKYFLLITRGLSGKDLKADDGRIEHLEIALALPEDYRFSEDQEKNFEVYMFIEIAKHLICADRYTGFGYYLKRDQSFSAHTAFTGAMLSALGDFKKDASFFKNSNGEDVIFYEVLPLRPMEVSYRDTHSAYELLERFKEKLIMLTPFIATRDDAVQTLFRSKEGL